MSTVPHKPRLLRWAFSFKPIDMELKLIGGKFMRGNEEEKPEIGNLEQIQILKRHEKRFDQFQEGCLIDPDIDPTRWDEECDDVEYVISARVTCVCGQSVYFERTSYDNDADHLEGSKSTCKDCKRRYIVEIDDDDDLVVKFNN